MSATLNGKPQRKQLADQLDRLDSVIDTLGGGLNAAVADACREGARAAVREVILELIANPDLLAAVRGGPALVVTDTPDEPRPPAPPLFWNRVKDGVKGAGRSVSGATRTLTKTVEKAVKPVTDALRLTGTTRTVVAAAVVVGLAAGAVSLVCPAWVGAAVSAGASASAVGAAYIGAAVNRVWASFRLA